MWKQQNHRPQRLIAFLQGALGAQYSGKCLRKVLEANGCRVNGNVERFASARLCEGDMVELVSGWETLSKVSGRLSTQRFDILYEDEETLWVNKPAGFVCGEKECEMVFGKGIYLLHRLDRETTGVLGLAKGRDALAKWSTLFAQRELDKSYLALVDRVPQCAQGEIRSFLQRKGFFQGQTIWGSGKRGVEAITRWEVAYTGNGFSLLRCKPLTGRTHQIRVHLAEMGHPILIDRQYAKRFTAMVASRRPLLHAAKVETPFFSVEAPLPQDLASWIKL